MQRIKSDNSPAGNGMEWSEQMEMLKNTVRTLEKSFKLCICRYVDMQIE
jgi:hypothetical protein